MISPFEKAPEKARAKLDYSKLDQWGKGIVDARIAEEGVYYVAEIKDELKRFRPGNDGMAVGPYWVEARLDIKEVVDRTPGTQILKRDKEAVDRAPGTQTSSGDEVRICPGTIDLVVTGGVRITLQPGHDPTVFKSHWRLGFIQQVNSLSRTIYSPTSKVTYQKYTITLPGGPIRDCPEGGTDEAPPFYDPHSQIKIDRACTIITYGARLFDAPGVHFPQAKFQKHGQPALSQLASFTTWLVLMRGDRNLGLTLARWDWKADFGYLDRPNDGIKFRPGGLTITHHDKHRQPTLPPFPPDTPRGLEVLSGQGKSPEWSSDIDVPTVQKEIDEAIQWKMPPKPAGGRSRVGVKPLAESVRTGMKIDQRP